ncbi:hypothetical protein TNCV_2325051 [Trichonephila clavipes]|nr:hypothetical protein TNCV_2325051 [Trichonephila clavipes]
MMAAFMLDAMPVNAVFECVVERHSSLTLGVMPAYSPDMSPIDHVWDLVGRRLDRDPRPIASKDELLLRIQAIWNSLPQSV